MIRVSGSPLSVGSVARWSASACAARCGCRHSCPTRPRASRLPASRCCSGALALEVVDRDRDPLPGGVLLEGLDQRRPVALVVEPRVVSRREQVEVPDRCHRAGLVDERLLDRVGADEAGVDVVVGAGRGRRVEGVDDLLGGLALVVLDLDQAEHVGVDLPERRHDLVELAHPLRLGVGATAVLGPVGTADAGAVGRRLVDRREVVQHVERRDGRACRPQPAGARAGGWSESNA